MFLEVNLNFCSLISAMSFLLLPKVRDLFSEAYGEVFHVQLPDEEEGRKFFEDLLLNQAAQPAASKRKAGEERLQGGLCLLLWEQPFGICLGNRLSSNNF